MKNTKHIVFKSIIEHSHGNQRGIRVVVVESFWICQCIVKRHFIHYLSYMK